MNWLKQWNQKLNQAWARVSRGRKLAINLTLSVLLLTLSWIRLGCPLPTAGMEFRRMERTHLLPPSEIVFTAGSEKDILWGGSWNYWPVQALDGTELYLLGRWFAGVGEDWAVIALVEGRDYDRFLQVFPLEDGPSLLPFHSGYGYWKEENSREGLPGETHNFFPILLVNVPEETSQMEITVCQGEDSASGPGWDMGGGVWVLTPDNQTLSNQPSGALTYTLRLYRADGSLLLEQCGEYRED